MLVELKYSFDDARNNDFKYFYTNSECWPGNKPDSLISGYFIICKKHRDNRPGSIMLIDLDTLEECAVIGRELEYLRETYDL